MKHIATISITAIITALSLNAYADTALIDDSFESTSTKWKARGSESVAISGETAHSGSQSLMISNRSSVWHGAQLSSDEFASAGTYHVECYVSYSANYAEHKFQLCWQNTIGSETSYPTINESSCKTGEWAKLTGTFAVTSEMKNISVYVQTAYTSNPTDEDLIDFYIDDFKCTKIETGNFDIASLSNNTPLKQLYSAYFKVGTAVTASELAMEKTKPLIEYHFNSVTPGNELKPDALLNQTQCQKDNKPAVRLSNGAKSILQYCSDNNIPFRGHCLVWHSQTPEWFFREGFKTDGALLGKDDMTKRMDEYIKAVIELVTTSYPNLNIYAWDVVNEAFGDGNGQLRTAGTNASKGESLWTKIYGDQSFIDSAFHFARKYAPATCSLYYNDFNEYIDAKRDAIYALVKRLYENGTCDGIGMQSHLATSYPSVSQYETALKKFCEIGCDIQVTELDITIENGATEKTQAKMYSDLFDLYIKHADNISAVVFWGTQDGTSWRSSKNPLIFNADFEPKESFFSIIDGLELPGTGINQRPSPTDNSSLKVYGQNGYVVIEPETEQPIQTTIYRIDGLPMGSYAINGRTEICLPNGIYIIERQTVVVM